MIFIGVWMGRAAKKKHTPKKVGLKEKNKTKRLQYWKEDVLHVLKEVKRGEWIAGVSRKYRIPELTLRAKKESEYADKKPGPAPVLSTEEEEEVVNWIFHCYKAGFPVTKSQLLITLANWLNGSFTL